MNRIRTLFPILTLLVVSILLCVSCEANPLTMREVSVILPKAHPWERAQSQSFWYTLVWNEGPHVRHRHLKPTEREVNIWVKRGETVVFCAYPLGTFSPYGGAVMPTQKGVLYLREDEGRLCNLLIESLSINSLCLGGLVYDRLLEQGRLKTDDLSLLYGNLLQKDLVNGQLNSSSFQVLSPLEVVVSTIPQGFWLGEGSAEGSFWMFWGSEGVNLLLGDGLHCYWNREDALLLRIVVDSQGQQYFSSVQKGPLW